MKRAAFLIAAVMWIGPPTQAGDLFTPMITASNVGNGRNIECRVVNVGTKPQEVTAELIIDSGVIVDSQTCNVDPGREGCVVFGSCDAPAFYCRAYCHFAAKSTRRIRGSIILTPQTTGDAVAALPAF